MLKREMTATFMTKTAFAALIACVLVVLVAELTAGPGRADARPAADATAFNVSGTRYDLFAGDLTKVDRVSFALTPPSAREVWVRVDASGAWHPCAERLTRFVCTLSSPVDLVDTIALQVFAHG
jgi:hypothetical protein